ncbi:MAG: polysaccharide deacetylase family protein [Bacteroidota bacterium]|nr:polysaccharide deacetylase family protein [Bacteroidota bacterium]
MLIYCKVINPRVEYIFDFLLSDLLGISIDFSTDFIYFDSYQGPKINYSSQASEKGWFLRPSELLFESGITEQALNVFEHKEVKSFFKTSDTAEIPFDLFAASFYLISRYEEYLPFEADKHNRFPAEQSLAFKNNFLHLPVVNIWLENFKTILLKHYPDLQIKKREYEFISTIDVDNGYAYLGKSWWRSMGALIRLFIKLDFKTLLERKMVLLSLKKDPFDLYDIQKRIQNKYKFKSIYFLLCGKQSKNDHNILASGRHFKKIVRELLEFSSIGLHPSYESNKLPVKVKQEKQILENIAQQEIIRSRQHFLKMKLPNTYYTLMDAGIKEDYTMGYASQVGFKAGICCPFKFYDLKKEKTTDLTIFPFVVMDGTLMNYLNVKPTDAIAIIKPLIEQVKSVNGIFISIWHDSTFAKTDEMNNWKEVYEKMVEIAVKN